MPTALMFFLILIGLFSGDFIFQYVTLLPSGIEEYAYFGTIAILAAGAGLLLHMYKGRLSRIFIICGALIGLIIPTL